MEKFYQQLLSNVWEDRLQAYATMERDLRRRGCYALNDDKWEDMKLLVGQIISIYFKKHPVRDLGEFRRELISLYKRLLEPLARDKSPGHQMSKQLLIDIYDDDDYAAQKGINAFFAAPGALLAEKKSVLGNLFRCYEHMMEEVEERSAAVLENNSKHSKDKVE